MFPDRDAEKSTKSGRFAPGVTTPAPLRALMVGILTVAALSLAGCGGDGGSGEGSADRGSSGLGAAGVVPPLPDRVEVFTPDDPIAVMDVVEDMSEEVANRFVALSETLRKRHFPEAAAFFADDFAGHALDGATPGKPESLPLGVERLLGDVAAAGIAGRDDWLSSLARVLEPFGVLEGVVLKVKGAEFQGGNPVRGRVKVKAAIQGREPDGAMRAVTAWSWCEVESVRDEWMVKRWELTSLETTTRPAPLFTDVAVPAGVANKVGRFGQDGPKTFYWNGAASGDFDGDGRFDLFVPSHGRSFLYRNRGDGRFDEVSGAWGLGAEADGTGALFFDYDNDGDADLFVAHVGWTRRDGKPGGDSLRLYRNDGKRFTDVTEASGFSGRHVAFSLVAADYDGNGHTDVYVCNYNRMDAVYPESWHHAENGTPNALYMNQGDGTFMEEAAARGAADSRWTFAGAAADHDADGDLDLYLANDYGDNAFLVNDGTGHFTDRAAEYGLLDTGNGMGAAWGDIDNDADLDLYVANMSSTAGNRILSRLLPPAAPGVVDGASDGESEAEVGGKLFKLAAGNSIFQAKKTEFRHKMKGVELAKSEVPPERPPVYERVPGDAGGTGAAWAWSSAFLDIDLDGNQDVMVANGFITGESAADT